LRSPSWLLLINLYTVFFVYFYWRLAIRGRPARGFGWKLLAFASSILFTVVFIGFVSCPDVCPTTMIEMANVMKELGADADKVQVLFVTVDPERDTQEVLSQYVPAFDKRFLGLRGDLPQTEKVAKEFKVFYQKVPGKQPGSYTMDHTAGSYVFDTQGHIRLFVKHGQGPQTLTHDIKLLLN
jgi:protein SCO1/2